MTAAEATAWERDSEVMLYATRGLAEHDVNHMIEECGIGPVSRRDVDLLRAAIVIAATHTREVLAEAGWLRNEPTVAIGDTRLPAYADQARRVLKEWEEQ